jgi:hypothetical protein
MPRDRRHWNAVAQAFAEDERQRALDAAMLTPEQRILLGLEMGALTSDDAASEEEWFSSSVVKAQLHSRWREIQSAHGNEPR